MPNMVLSPGHRQRQSTLLCERVFLSITYSGSLPSVKPSRNSCSILHSCQRCSASRGAVVLGSGLREDRSTMQTLADEALPTFQLQALAQHNQDATSRFCPFSVLRRPPRSPSSLFPSNRRSILCIAIASQPLAMAHLQLRGNSGRV